MPRTLFDQTLVSTSPQRRRPLGTVLLSVLLHALVLGAILALQLTGALSTPLIASRLNFVLAAPLPVPPAVTPARAAPSPSPAATTSTVPLEAPDRVRPEPETLPVPAHTLGDMIDQPGGIGVPGTDSTVHLAAPPPPPAPKGPLPVGGDVKPPVRLDHISVEYPPLARTARVEGDVVLEATIDESGAVTHLTVRKSVPLLDAAAIAAVSRWRYSPTRLNGQAVAVTMLVTVHFTLR